MKHLRKHLLFALLLITSIAQAQITGTKKFIYLPYEYNFCVEQSGISILIPENWGFQIPVTYLSDNSASLSIYSNIVNYSMRSDVIRNPSSILFIMPEAKTPCLELQVSAFGSEQMDESTLVSDFGRFYKVDQIKPTKEEAYQHISDSQVITFRILTENENEKQICRKIISSAQPCYEIESNEEDVVEVRDDYMERHSIRYYAKDSTYYPSLGFTFITPFDMSAEIKAPNININASETLLTAYVTLDEISEESTAGYFWENSFNMKYKFIKKSEELDVQSIANEYLDLDLYLEKCRRTFIYPVNQIPSTFYVLGQATSPTIFAVIPTKEYYAIFAFDNVMGVNMDHISTIISQIHIDDPQKEGLALMEDYSLSLNELVNIQPFSKDLNLKAIDLNKKSSTKGISLIECHIPDAKAVISLPSSGEEIYLYPTGETPEFDKNKKIVVTLNKTSSSESEDIADSGVMTLLGSYDERCILWIPENSDGLSVEQYLQKTYMEDECKAEDRVSSIERGICTIKGQKWYVVKMSYDDDEYVFNSYLTEANGILLEIIAVSKNDISTDAIDYIKVIESLLYKSTFK